MNVRHLVDPEVAEVIGALALPDDEERRQPITTQRARRQAAVVSAGPLDGIERADHDVGGGLTVRVYRPSAVRPPRPCLYWMHGGGYMFGTYTGNDAELERWCSLLDCVAVSVEYRLAPEHPYPAPLDDCYAGLAWTFERAGELGIDTERIGIGGVSAGGGLAAGLGLLARDRGELPLAFQLLICPMLDDRETTVSSTWESYVWTPFANRAGWQAYLGDLYGADVPVYAAPARAEDLAGLPPTLIEVGGLELFFDESVEYARRLTHALVPVELHVFPSVPHGFERLASGSAVARRAWRAFDDWLAAMLRARHVSSR